jgi:hypothetical protein
MQFLTDTRNDAAQAAERSRLPRACVQHGMCFLRALPYLGDTGFAVALDSLSRVHPNPHIRFPSTLVDGQACQVTGTLSDGVAKSGLQVRVNGVIAGEPTIDGSFLFFSHIADPLPTGFHLLSITTPDGRPIAARFVEKLEARDHGQMESWSAIELLP